MNIVVNGILTDYLSLWGSDVDLVVVSFSELNPYCRILVATIGLVKAHKMLRQKRQRRSGTDTHYQECKLVQGHQQER